MKKTTLLFILFLTGLMACSTPEDKPKNKTMLPRHSNYSPPPICGLLSNWIPETVACGKYNTTFKATTEWKSC